MSIDQSRATVQSIVRTARRTRQSARTLEAIAHLAPFVAACALGLAALGVVTPLWRLAGVAVMMAGLLAALAAWLVSLIPRVASDEVVRRIDMEAALEGALRSAYWFATSPDADPGQSARVDWWRYHVATAADQVAGVEWRRVYPVTCSTKRVVITAALCLAAMGATARSWSTPAPAFRPTEADSDSAAIERLAGALPAADLPMVVEGLRALRNGQPPSAEALAAVGRAIEVAKANAVVGQELERMFEGADALGASSGGTEDDQFADGQLPEDWDPRLAALGWAYEDARSKSATREETAANSPDASKGSSEERGAETQAQAREESASGAAASSDAPGEAVTESGSAVSPEGFSSVLFGPQASADAGARATPSAQRAAALAAALRREEIAASTDLSGANVTTVTSRRATNDRAAPPSAVSGSLSASYARVGSSQPPAVPADRRELVHDYFARSTTPTRSASQP